MAQLGETIAVPEFFTDEQHDENTCPWHETGKTKSEVMEEQDPDEDSYGAIPPNLGGTLGKNLNAAGEKAPEADCLEICYEPGDTIAYMAGGKKKQVSTYGDTATGVLYEYPLQYAPHHLVPGNESLKDSDVVPFMGDDSAIKLYTKEASLIKEGKSICYDVNAAENGVWLPSPYALSMSNKWPSANGIKVLKKRKHKLLKSTETFGLAYAVESMANGRQFHMRHNLYSKKVKEILNAIADKLKVMATGGCPLAEPDENELYEPPMGLVARLNLVSANMKRLLIGPIWRDPLFADDKLTKVYVTEKLARTDDVGDIDRIL